MGLKILSHLKISENHLIKFNAASEENTGFSYPSGVLGRPWELLEEFQTARKALGKDCSFNCRGTNFFSFRFQREVLSENRPTTLLTDYW